MSCLLDRLLKQKDHGRQYRHTADHAKGNALHHDQADVQTEAESHKAQRRETGYSRDRRSHYGFERLVDRHSHCFLGVIVDLLVFLETVPQKDRVVHCDAKLQDCRQRFCYI